MIRTEYNFFVPPRRSADVSPMKMLILIHEISNDEKATSVVRW